MTSIFDLEKKAYEAFKPPKKLSLSDWADEYARLSVESSAEGGRWRTLPYQKGINIIINILIYRIIIRIYIR